MNRTKYPLFILITLILLALAACGGAVASPPAGAIDLETETQQVPVDGGAYNDVSVEGLAAMLETKDFPLINVHIPYEGEIEGTDEFVPFNEIESNLDKFPEDKDAQIVVYCRSGSMSTQAAKRLAELGYTNVMELDGGFRAWTAAGYSIAGQ